MSKRFSWAKNLPKTEPEADDLHEALSQRLQPVQGLPVTVSAQPASLPAPVVETTRIEPPAPTTSAAPKPKDRLLHRRDGRKRTEIRTIEGRIRGGKYSGQWGRDNSDIANGDWVGVRLPPGYNAKLKHLGASHDLYVWQVMTEAVDLFLRTYGETPKHRDKP